jgi:hypothetical protein
LATAFGVTALDARYAPQVAVNTAVSSQNQEVSTIDKNKKLSEINFAETRLFANKVFGSGPATDLLIKLSKDNPNMINRVIAVAKHE